MKCPSCDQETPKRSETQLLEEIKELKLRNHVERTRADSYQAVTRDSFASAAMTGLCANSEPGEIFNSDGSRCLTVEEIQARFAELSYGYADAMLKARKLQPE